MTEVRPYIHNTAEGVDVKEYLDHRLDRGVYYAVRVSEKQLVTLTRFPNLFSYLLNIILHPMEFWRGWRQGTQVRDWCTTQLPPTAQLTSEVGAAVLGQQPSAQSLLHREPLTAGVTRVAERPSHLGVHEWAFPGGADAQQAWELVFFAYDISIISESTPSQDKEGMFTIKLDIKSDDEYERVSTLAAKLTQPMTETMVAVNAEDIYDRMNREAELPLERFQSRLLHYVWDHYQGSDNMSILASASFYNIFREISLSDLRGYLESEGILEAVKSYVVPLLERGELTGPWVNLLGVIFLQDVSVKCRVELLVNWRKTYQNPIPEAAMDEKTIELLSEKAPARAFYLLRGNSDFRRTEAFFELILKELLGEQKIPAHDIPQEIEERVYTTLFQKDREKALAYYSVQIIGIAGESTKKIWSHLLQSGKS